MVSVGDVIHKVRLRLHSEEERKEEERIQKGRSQVILWYSSKGGVGLS